MASHPAVVPLLLFLAAVLLMACLWVRGSSLPGCSSRLCAGDRSGEAATPARLYLPVWFEAASSLTACPRDESGLLMSLAGRGCGADGTDSALPVGPEEALAAFDALARLPLGPIGAR